MRLALGLWLLALGSWLEHSAHGPKELEFPALIIPQRSKESGFNSGNFGMHLLHLSLFALRCYSVTNAVQGVAVGCDVVVMFGFVLGFAVGFGFR